MRERARGRVSLLPALALSPDVALAYWDEGSGDPPLLLVHGWLCDHTYLAPQAAFFRGSHRVVSLDLRGHGESPAPASSCTIANFAADLAALCASLELHRPILIGHSMGGVAGYELAAAQRELPAGLVLIDSPVVTAASGAARRRALVDDLRSPGWREAAHAYVENMFVPGDSARLRERVVAGMLNHDPELMATAMESALSCASFSAATAARLDLPVLQIGTARGALPDLARLAELCPRLSNGQAVGTGHFCQIETPDQVNAMIRRWLGISF
jgi:pimeloyl-ACP methyl ester carboxylesterase